MKNGLFLVKNDSFLVKNGSFLVKNELFLVKNDSFLVKNGSFLVKNKTFLVKNGSSFVKDERFAAPADSLAPAKSGILLRGKGRRGLDTTVAGRAMPRVRPRAMKVFPYIEVSLIPA